MVYFKRSKYPHIMIRGPKAHGRFRVPTPILSPGVPSKDLPIRQGGVDDLSELAEVWHFFHEAIFSAGYLRYITRTYKHYGLGSQCIPKPSKSRYPDMEVLHSPQKRYLAWLSGPCIMRFGSLGPVRCFKYPHRLKTIPTLRPTVHGWHLLCAI